VRGGRAGRARRRFCRSECVFFLLRGGGFGECVGFVLMCWDAGTGGCFLGLRCWR